MINREISFDETTVKILFNKYKMFLMPLVIILICIIVFFSFIVPQIQELSSMNDEVKAVKEKILILRQNLNLLSNLNSDNQNIMLQKVSKALPMEKDFIGVLNAVSNASINAGVKLDDFSFAVGDLSTKSTQVNAIPSFKLVVTVDGGIDGARRFLDGLSESSPISEVQTVDISNSSSTVAISFYYRVVSPIKIDYISPFKSISSEEKALIDKITAWQLNIPNFSPKNASSGSILKL